MEGEEGSLDKVPTSVESVKVTRSVIKPTVSSSLKVSGSGSSTATTRKRIEPKNVSNVVKSTPRKPTIDHGNSKTTSNAAPIRRNSTGSLPEKQQVSVKKPISNVSSSVGKKISSSNTTEPKRLSLPEARLVRTSSSEIKKSVSSSSSSVVRTSRTANSNSEASKGHSSLTSSVKLSPSSRVPSTSIDSTASSTSRKPSSKLSSSARSSAVSSGSKSGSLSSSREKMSTLSSQRKAVPEVRVSRLIMLPQVEVKAGDDVRLDHRGHRIRSLKAGLNMSPNLEFVYLRDNLLSSLEGIEILKRVKVLDLSFNDFKGPGFEPLEACKVLQQLYLAGNQITSLS